MQQRDFESASVFDFDAETAVLRIGDGRYVCELDPTWWVFRGPNGGYLAAIVLRALAAVVDDPARAARSLTVHYATPPREGTIEMTARVERAGRSLSTCSARIEQDGRIVGLALAAFGAVRSGPELCDLTMPDVAPPETLPVAPVGPDSPAIAGRWETRWAIGEPPDRDAPTEVDPAAEAALIACWIRLPERRPVDSFVAAALSDAAIPAVFRRIREPVMVPTVDLTIHFRSALPAPGAAPDDFVLAVFRTGAVAEGFLEEDGELWSRDGTLLAQSRQLAALLPFAR